MSSDSNKISEDLSMPLLTSVEPSTSSQPDLCAKNDVDHTESNSEGEYDDWNAEEGDEDFEASKPKCVACPSLFDSVAETLQHILEKHSFDFQKVIESSAASSSERFYNHIKLVNYLRRRYSGAAADEKIVIPDDEAKEWMKEEYLKPVIDDDALLYLGNDDDDEDPFILPQGSNTTIDASKLFADLSREELEKKLLQVQIQADSTSSKLSYLESQLASLQRLNQALLEEPTSSRRSRKSKSAEGSKSDDDMSGSDDSSSDGGDVPFAPSYNAIVKEIDSGYFGGYAGFHIHEDMLKDKVRTEAYRDFIEGNPGIFNGKIVLDVGCGTGILSMFAARAGAKHVIAIDNSGIIERAREIAAENNLQDKITFIRGKAEKIDNLAGICDKVDIIISEWMGYCLLYESMLPSVLFVRDRWLKKDTGRVYPDIASLHIIGMSAPGYRKSRVDFWKKDVYGFCMNSIASRVHLEPGVDHMQDYSVITTSHNFFEIDCNRVKAEQLDFKSDFSITSQSETLMDAFVTYFDIGFIKDAEKPITFTTSPTATETHWRQTVLILENPIQLSVGDVIKGTIELKANRESFRDLDIHLTYQIGEGPVKSQSFSLN